MAVRLAVAGLTADDLAMLHNLTDAMNRCAERGDVAKFFEANLAFHALWFELSGNAQLQEFYRKLLGQMSQHRSRALELRGNLQGSVAEHKAVLAAAEAGDAEGAAGLMAQHIRVPQLRLSVLSDEEFDRPKPQAQFAAAHLTETLL